MRADNYISARIIIFPQLDVDLPNDYWVEACTANNVNIIEIIEPNNQVYQIVFVLLFYRRLSMEQKTTNCTFKYAPSPTITGATTLLSNRMLYRLGKT